MEELFWILVLEGLSRESQVNVFGLFNEWIEIKSSVEIKHKLNKNNQDPVPRTPYKLVIYPEFVSTEKTHLDFSVTKNSSYSVEKVISHCHYIDKILVI